MIKEKPIRVKGKVLRLLEQLRDEMSDEEEEEVASYNDVIKRLLIEGKYWKPKSKKKKA